MRRQRAEIVTAAFAASHHGASFDPIRAQKLLFLIDREVAAGIGGPFFRFKPFLYGPFDRAVYDVIQDLVAEGDALIETTESFPRYRLTPAGHRRGRSVLASLPDPVADYVVRVSRWVRRMPYRQMLRAVYRKYPDMAVDSVVRSLGLKPDAKRHHPFVRGMTRAFDFTGSMYRSPDSTVGLDSDAEAIHNDWRAVGGDFEKAMARFGESEQLW